jgi:hypothetical protein
MARLDRNTKRKVDEDKKYSSNREERMSLLEAHMASRPKKNPDEIDFDRDVRHSGSNRQVAEFLKNARGMASRFKPAG